MTAAPQHIHAIMQTYFDLGALALSKGQFDVAEKMYAAALEEPVLKRNPERYLFPLLKQMAFTRENQRKFYRAKLLYIRALAHYKRHKSDNDSQVFELFCILARVNAKQDLHRQALEFLREARSVASGNPSALSEEGLTILATVHELLEMRAPLHISSAAHLLLLELSASVIMQQKG